MLSFTDVWKRRCLIGQSGEALEHLNKKMKRYLGNTSRRINSTKSSCYSQAHTQFLIACGATRRPTYKQRKKLKEEAAVTGKKTVKREVDVDLT